MMAGRLLSLTWGVSCSVVKWTIKAPALFGKKKRYYFDVICPLAFAKSVCMVNTTSACDSNDDGLLLFFFGFGVERGAKLPGHPSLPLLPT